MRPLSVFVVSLVLASAARADGRYYSVEEIPPDLPYQRAFLARQDGVETLVLVAAASNGELARLAGELGLVDG